MEVLNSCQTSVSVCEQKIIVCEAVNKIKWLQFLLFHAIHSCAKELPTLAD